MSSILDALKKAKEFAGKKPSSPPPTALASFRFGRPTKAQQIRKVAVLGVLLLAGASSIAYTANFMYKRLRKPRAAATLVVAPVAAPVAVSTGETTPPPVPPPETPPSPTVAPPPAAAPKTESKAPHPRPR